MALFNSMTFGLCAFLLLYVPHVVGICQSYGVDFFNNGNYFINTGSSNFFNFTSFFEGCEPGDVANTVVTLPSTDYDYCTDVATTPDDTDVTGVCNVDSFEIRKSDMLSGEYIIQLIGNNAAGDPFAWQRNVYITAGTQVTLTATPTVTFTITTTPEITTTTTQVDTFTTSLQALTTTVPSKTLKNTITITPSKVTLYSTTTVTRTTTTRTYTVLEATRLVHPPCIPWPPPKDTPVTALPTGLQNPLLASVVSAAAVVLETAAVQKRKADQVADKLAYRNFVRREEELARRGLARRSPDQPTVVVVETTSIISITSTITAPTITDVETVYVQTTVTYTPPVVTVFSGKTQVTVTAPTSTKTRSTRVKTTVSVTKTIKATNTLTVTTGNPTPCGSGVSYGGNGPQRGRVGHGPYGSGNHGPNGGGHGGEGGSNYGDN